MATLIRDTHRFVQRLVESGMPQSQAEVLVEEFQDGTADSLATKADLQTLELKIERVKNQLLYWIVGLFVAQTGALWAFIQGLR